MNREEFKLPIFTLRKYMVRPFLRCVFNTLLFNRMIYKMFKTGDFYCNVLEVGYPQLLDKKIQMRLEDEIQSIYQSIIEQKPIMIDFSFFSYFKKKGILGSYKERFVWEKWLIPIKCREEEHGDIRDYLSHIFLMMLKKTQHLDHVTRRMNINYFEVSWNTKLKSRKSSWKKFVNGIKKFSPPQFDMATFHMS